MEKSQAVYRNLVVLIVSLVFINLAIGFYKSFSKIKNVGTSSISFRIQDKTALNYFTNRSTVDFISQAEEMIDIFENMIFQSIVL